MRVKIELDLNDEQVESVLRLGDMRGFRCPSSKKKDKKATIARIADDALGQLVVRAADFDRRAAATAPAPAE